MTISVVLASITASMLRSNYEALSAFAKKDAKTPSDLNGLGILLAFVYMVIAIFMGAKWYLSPLLFFGAIFVGGILAQLFSRILGKVSYASDNWGDMRVVGVTYNKYVVLVVSLLQLVSVVFAYIAWF